VTDIPAQDLSAANTTAFFPEKGKIDYNKDSLNQIIESRIVDIQKQRENEFLQEKFVALQKEVQEALNVFQNDNFFPKQKQESLSDQQLSLYWKNIEKANDLPSLAVACEKVVSYIDKLLNKKDIEVE
jgi:Txe/YoeB family toxin of Txe-Axe toxin-antitoxin module